MQNRVKEDTLRAWFALGLFYHSYFKFSTILSAYIRFSFSGKSTAGDKK